MPGSVFTKERLEKLDRRFHPEKWIIIDRKRKLKKLKRKQFILKLKNYFK